MGANSAFLNVPTSLPFHISFTRQGWSAAKPNCTKSNATGLASPGAGSSVKTRNSIVTPSAASFTSSSYPTVALNFTYPCPSGRTKVSMEGAFTPNPLSYACPPMVIVLPSLFLFTFGAFQPFTGLASQAISVRENSLPSLSTKTGFAQSAWSYDRPSPPFVTTK